MLIARAATPRFSTIPLYLTLSLSLFCSHSANARSCNYYKEQAEHFEQMQRAGGTARQMNRWRVKNSDMEEQYHKCLNNPDTNPSIQVATAPTKKSARAKTSKATSRSLRNTDVADPLLQSLIKTCNFWIGTANEKATQDNLSFRESACTAADKREQELTKPFQTTAQLPTRKLKDCIKPNNVVDNEVNDCVMGRIEPTWRK